MKSPKPTQKYETRLKVLSGVQHSSYCHEHKESFYNIGLSVEYSSQKQKQKHYGMTRRKNIILLENIIHFMALFSIEEKHGSFTVS